MIADQHLEETLKEYNEKISDLENNGTREDLLEALVNRSIILYMMESYVSSLADVEEALDIADEMQENGEVPNIGSLVKLYELHGKLSYYKDNEQMVSDYMKVCDKLITLEYGARHYNKKELIMMCMDCAEDLIDQDYSENALPFLENGLLFLGTNYDPWSNNRRIEMYNLMGQVHEKMGLTDAAMKDYSDSISPALKMYQQKRLDDVVGLILALVNKGSIEGIKGEREGQLRDFLIAIEIMEQLEQNHKLADIELLIGLHRNVASVLSDLDRAEESEKHLLRALVLSLPSSERPDSDRF